jgi:hypothetical protein
VYPRARAILRYLVLASALQSASACSAGPPADYFVRQGSGCRDAYPRCGVDEPGREFDDVDQCGAALRPGDTCWIKDGVYARGIDGDSGRAYQPRRSGTRERRIAYRAYPGAKPVFRGPATWTMGHKGEISYVTYDGLRVEGVLRIQGESEDERTQGVIVENCELIGGGGKDDGNWSALFAQWTEDLVVRNNTIRFERPAKSGHGQKGLSLFNARRARIENNRISGFPDEAIFDKEGGEENAYRRNWFESNRIHIKLSNQPDERGIYNVGSEVSGNLFRCDPEQGGIALQVLSQATGWRVFQNTGIGCDAIEVRSKSGPASGGEVWNNLWWHPKPGADWWASSHGDDREPAFMDYNLYTPGGRFLENNDSDGEREFERLAGWAAVPHPQRYDQHSLEAEPWFRDYAMNDFRPIEESKARRAGRNGEDLGAWPSPDAPAPGPNAGALRVLPPRKVTSQARR